MKWLVVFFVFSGIILSSFQHKTNLVLVEQIESNFPIVIRYDSIKDYIFRIQFPLMFKVCNISIVINKWGIFLIIIKI